MRFRLFGIPVEIQLGFWMISVFLGWNLLSGPRQYLIVEWVFVVLISVLVHEMGHAFAMRRHGLEPEVQLYSMGGLTMTQGMNRLTRPQRIFVSFAGPLAGFLLGATVYGLTLAVPLLTEIPTIQQGAPQWTLYHGIRDLMWVNIGWGLVNLIPVLPLDGGHILEDALGPRRARTTAALSLAIGAGIVLLGLWAGQHWIAFIFGLGAYHSYQRFKAAGPASPQRPRAAAPPMEVVSPQIQARLAQAREALWDDRFDQAGTLAELVLAEGPPQSAKKAALEIIAWAHLLEERPKEAARALSVIEKLGTPDPALVGALLLHNGNLDGARKVFEAARGAGNDSKQVVGPLIQILIQQKEIARAAAIALDIIDTLSDEDARQMAAIAFDNEHWSWAARISEALFERTNTADDAYAAARSRSNDGDAGAALRMVEKAVGAGFSDAARAWSDKALASLQTGDMSAELETLLPRP